MVNVIVYVRSGILSVVRMGFDELRNEELLLDEELDEADIAPDEDSEGAASPTDELEVMQYPGQFDDATLRINCQRLSRANLGLLRGIFQGTDRMHSLSITGDGGRIDATDLAQCIETAAAGDSSRLKILRLEGVLGVTDGGDLLQLRKSMEKHLKGLNSVQVGFDKIEGTCDVSGFLDCFFLSRELGAVSEINLCCWQSPEVIWQSSTKCLEGLKERDNLLSLNLGTFELSDDDILKMAACLPVGLVSLTFLSKRDLDHPGKCGRAVADFIAASEHLQSLVLGTGTGVDETDEFFVEVANGIRRNGSLGECDLQLPYRSTTVDESILAMVEGNCSMINLSHNMGYSSPSLVDFLLELNSMGRSQIMGVTEEAKNASYEDWTDVMVKSADAFLTEQDKTSTLYYYLTRNPPIVACAAEHAQKVVHSKKRQYLWPSKTMTKHARCDEP